MSQIVTILTDVHRPDTAARPHDSVVVIVGVEDAVLVVIRVGQSRVLDDQAALALPADRLHGASHHTLHSCSRI